ncbi:MAG: TonB-dependent receptor, partial [Acidobacteriaceae bacterium]
MGKTKQKSYFWIRMLCFAGLILAAVLPAPAQSDLASVTGTVKDASGAVIPGVQVTVTNLSTNLTLHVATNGLGFYTVLNLPVGGPYQVTFQASGFGTMTRTGLMLAVAQVAKVDATLKLGASTQTVVVSANAPLLRTQSATVSTNMTSKEVELLPLNIAGGRQLSAFMFAYIPGVTGSDYTSHINGSMGFSKEVMIDGVSAVSQLGGNIIGSQPPMDAVGEYEADTAGTSADIGQSGGGVFRYEMKSGTNTLHGSLFGFMHNQVLDSNSWWNNYQKGYWSSQYPDKSAYYDRIYSLPSDTMSDWGASLGGPLLKNKLFYFGAFERYMFSGWALGGLYGTVPNSNFLNGNLSALLNKNVVLGTDGAGNNIYQGSIFDPTTGNVFVNNQISPARFSQASQQVIALYKKYYQPQTQVPGPNNAAPATGQPWTHFNQSSLKIDYILSQKHRISGSYGYDTTPVVESGGVWSTDLPDGGPLSNAWVLGYWGTTAILSDIYTFSPNMLNTAHFALNRNTGSSKSVSAAGKWDQALGLGNFGAGSFPRITFNGSSYNGLYNMSAIGSAFDGFNAANTIIFNDNLSWIKGRHNFAFGGEFRAQQFNSDANKAGMLNITFSPDQTGAPTAPYAAKVGHAFASFLLGATNLASVPQPQREYGRRKVLSFYVTDTVKVSQKLTMNLGLDWNYNGRLKEKYGSWSNFDPTLTNPVT